MPVHACETIFYRLYDLCGLNPIKDARHRFELDLIKTGAAFS